jgi:transposase
MALWRGSTTKLKIKRQAYGFRDMEYFKLRPYSLHAEKYASIG